MPATTLEREACLQEEARLTDEREQPLCLRLHAEDWERLKWLAKDIGFRKFDAYVANAIRVYIDLDNLLKNGNKLYFGPDPLRAMPLALPYSRDIPCNWENREDDAELVIHLTTQQREALANACRLIPQEHFIWRALWGYYDLLESSLAGKQLYIGTERGPEALVDVSPSMGVPA